MPPLVTKTILARDLASLYKVSGSTINKWIREGRFSTASKVPGRGGGDGLVWSVNIEDPAISEEIRAFYERLVEQSLGLSTSDRAIAEIHTTVKNIERLLKDLLKGKK